MAKVVVNNSLTLDGVMQAPGRPDEDPRGGFTHGGWAIPYADEELASLMGQGFSSRGSLLLGRRTYEDLASVWPTMPADNPYTAVINTTRKLVASRTLTGPLAWQNSELLTGDAVDAVAVLREHSDGNLMILGSGELIQSLMGHHLIDTYVLLIHPLVLGSGRRMFPDGGVPADLRLVDTKTTAKGIVLATYEPA